MVTLKLNMDHVYISELECPKYLSVSYTISLLRIKKGVSMSFSFPQGNLEQGGEGG